MAHHFEDAGKNGKRRWMCFVCGRRHENYEDYKKHIAIEHDEGREYLSCPACEAPVRDMKTHYKVKHKNRALPKGVQMKVAVWKDFSPTGKKKRTRKPKFRTGEYESSKMKRLIHYRSGMEEEILGLLDEDKDVSAFYSEPFKIPYFYQGKWHNYIPDFRINFSDATTEVWEIKPASQTDYEVNKAKWASMHEYAQNMGWNFNVITEVGVGKLKSKIRKQKRRQN